MPDVVMGRPARKRDLTGKVACLRALLQRAAPKDIVDFAAFDASTRNGGGERVAAQCGTRCGVKPAAIGFADGGTGGGNDNCVTHDV